MYDDDGVLFLFDDRTMFVQMAGSWKGGTEGDGVYFVIKDKKAKEAKKEMRKWLKK